MILRITLFVFAFGITGCATIKEPNNPEKYASQVSAAQRIVDEFAEQHGWSKHVGPHFDSTEVYDSQETLWKRILEINDMDTSIPLGIKGLSAALEGRVLMAITPELQRELAPEYTTQEDAWVRLLAHEICHRMHPDILDGDEDRMGPQWFFEGFAVVCSGQNLGSIEPFSKNETALAAAKDTKTPFAYRRFAAAFRYFATKTSLQELVRRAGDENFEEWLLGL